MEIALETTIQNPKECFPSLPVMRDKDHSTRSECVLPTNFLAFNTGMGLFFTTNTTTNSVVAQERHAVGIVRIEYLYLLRDILRFYKAGLHCMDTPVDYGKEVVAISCPAVQGAEPLIGYKEDPEWEASFGIEGLQYDDPDFADKTRACLTKLMSGLEVAAPFSHSVAKGLWVTGHPGIGTHLHSFVSTLIQIPKAKAFSSVSSVRSG